MGARDYFKLGEWNCKCDRCGFKRKSSEIREEWDGLRVCSECWEPRHPQDFVRAIPDPEALPWTRPEPPDTFVSVTFPVPPKLF